VTATTISTPVVTATTAPARGPGMLARAWSDTITIVWRNLLNIRRTPQLLVFSTIQPVIFVLMFRYVFGGAIKVPGVPYVDYLMPGIFAQTIVFGAIGTGVGLAEDLSKGLVERFRSLPMARSAVLVGRSVADLLRNVFVVLLMVAVGYAVGFRIHDGVLRLGLAIVILLFFGFALSWIFAILGLFTKNAEATQAAAFPVLAPLVFASNAFVPLSAMPAPLQAFARNQPVSITVAAVRRLVLGHGANPHQVKAYEALGMTGSTWLLVFKALIWAVGIVAVFAPLAVRMYRKAN
jgi:ABC-2 type transport system permease protein/oleandomycin transport system permease protein